VEFDAALVEILKNALVEAPYEVHVDLHRRISMDWAMSISEKIRTADVVIVLASDQTAGSEMLDYELEIANDAKLKNGSMKMMLVPLGDESAANRNGMPLLGGHQTRVWAGDEDSDALIAEILEIVEGPAQISPTGVLVGESGGGISSQSGFYVEREADPKLRSCVIQEEPTTLIRGPRQTGKTSLLAKGIRIVQEQGWQTCVTDFQRMGSNLYRGEADFYQTLMATLARQLESEYGLKFDWSWEPAFAPTSNLNEFVVNMISATPTRVVWFMDEADALFTTSFADSFFALVRSWHNARAFSMDEIWSRFSVVIVYATEAHLFIQDINRSPFNVGQRIDLDAFTLRQVEDLNQQYGSPLRGIDQVVALQDLLEGQPFLTRAAFDHFAKGGGNLRTLLASADQDDGPFGDHLRRLLVAVTQLSNVRETIKKVLANSFVPASDEVSRLVSAGIVVPNSSGNHVFRCKLYRRYLESHLK
jgi:hypothetical protein